MSIFQNGESSDMVIKHSLVRKNGVCINRTLENRYLEFTLQVRDLVLLLYIINIFKNFTRISRNIEQYKSTVEHSRVLMCSTITQHCLSITIDVYQGRRLQKQLWQCFSDGDTSTRVGSHMCVSQLSECLVQKNTQMSVSNPCLGLLTQQSVQCAQKSE